MMKYFYALLASAALIVACSNAITPAAAPVAAAGPQSAHAAKVEAALYQPLPSSAPVNFAWDFAKPTPAAYTLSQTLESATGPDAEKLTRRVGTVTGMLTVAPATATTGTAAYSLMAIEHLADNSESRRSMMSPPPPATIAPDSSGADAMTRLMLPLPGKTLKPGESATFSVTLPVRAGGMPVPVPANVTVTYASDAKRGAKTLARLDSVVTPGAFSPPEGFKGEIIVTVSGSGRSYFDPAEGRLTESWTALRFTLDAKTPKPVPPDKKAPAVSEFVTFHLDSDNFFRLLKKE